MPTDGRLQIFLVNCVLFGHSTYFREPYSEQSRWSPSRGMTRTVAASFSSPTSWSKLFSNSVPVFKRCQPGTLDLASCSSAATTYSRGCCLQWGEWEMVVSKATMVRVLTTEMKLDWMSVAHLITFRVTDLWTLLNQRDWSLAIEEVMQSCARIWSLAAGHFGNLIWSFTQVHGRSILRSKAYLKTFDEELATRWRCL